MTEVGTYLTIPEAHLDHCADNLPGVFYGGTGYLRSFTTAAPWTLRLQRAIETKRRALLRNSRGVIGIGTLDAMAPGDLVSKVLLRDVIFWKTPIMGPPGYAVSYEALRRAKLVTACGRGSSVAMTKKPF